MSKKSWMEVNMQANMTENTTGNAEDKFYKLDAVDVPLAVGYIVIFVSALIGNSLLVAVVRRNTGGKMRSVSSYFIVSMAVADLAMAIGNVPERITRAFTGNEWLIIGSLGVLICKAVNFIEKMAILVSISNLTAIAADRFMNVFFPHRKIITTKGCFIIVGLIWILSAIYCSPILYYANVLSNDGKTLCKTRRFFPSFRAWFSPFLVILIGSLFVVVILYAAICIRLWRRKIPGRRPTSKGENENPTDKVNRKVLKMVTAIVVVFYMCFLPYWLSWIFCSYHFSPMLCNTTYTTISVFLSYTNISLNPVIYVTFSEHFREGFKAVFTSRRRGGAEIHPTRPRPMNVLAGIALKSVGFREGVVKQEQDENPTLQERPGVAVRNPWDPGVV